MAAGDDSLSSAVLGASARPETDSPSMDDDLDPAAFLRSVRELSDRRDREDAERVRKLEEEIEKGRQERARRRAEHARSISPEKRDLPARAHDLRTRSEIPSGHAPSGLAAAASPPPPLLKASPSEARASAAPVVPSTTTTPFPSADAPMAEQTSHSIEEVPEFRGFGSIKRSSTASSIRSSGNAVTSAPASTPEQLSDISTPRNAPSLATSSNASTETPPTSDPTVSSASTLARSGTLSWQRRPAPTATGSRPASIMSGESQIAAARTASPDTSEPSRDQITAALSARDPSWFRQTAERGVGSAAYRKSKDEVTIGDSAFTRGGAGSVRRGLPGMSRESVAEPDSQTSTQVSDTFSRGGSLRESVTSATSRSSTVSATSNKPDLKSLIAADEHQHRASPFDRSLLAEEQPDRASHLSTASSTIRAERSASPTKHTGDFVQSAMMRRSDSVNKRGSAQTGGSLLRSHPITSTSKALGKGSEDDEPIPQSVSSHAQGSTALSNSQETASNAQPFGRQPSAPSQESKSTAPRSTFTHHSRSRSIVSNHSAAEDGGAYQSPSSPSKRWSPTKSSWIESALTRPESPTKQTPPMKNSQPSWMVDLAKANAQRASADSTPTGINAPKAEEISRLRSASPDKSSPLGQTLLKRSDSGNNKPVPAQPYAPMSKPKPDFSSERRVLLNNDPQLQETADIKNTLTASRESHSPQVISSMPSTEPNEDPAPLSQADPTKPSQPAQRDRRAVGSFSVPRPKPEPPAKPITDFRSNLKSVAPAGAKPQETPEFLRKFGNLRPAQQEKFVAPDVLKQNIMRGKSGLAITGGPVKTERRDELKESLISKKDEIKSAKDEGRELPGQLHERKISSTKQPPPKPEALTRRDTLSRARTMPVSEASMPSTPEALVRRKSLKKKTDTASAATVTSAKASDDPRMEPLGKQVSAPGNIESKASVPETSKLAARFNPNLASLIARGSPSGSPARTVSPSVPEQTGPAAFSGAEIDRETGPLHDMRKERAKGPKKRKGSARTQVVDAASESRAPNTTSPGAAKDEDASQTAPDAQSHKMVDPKEDAKLVPELNPIPKTKPHAPPGSAAALMVASLENTPQRNTQAQNFSKPLSPGVSPPSFTLGGALEPMKPATSRKSPSLTSKSSPTPSTANPGHDRTQTSVPEFRGFGPVKSSQTSGINENRENTSSPGPLWERTPTSHGVANSPSVNSPGLTTRDSADSIRSSSEKPAVGLALGKIRGSATSSPQLPTSGGLPPKPAKSSRVVSGQLAEGNKNQGHPSPRAHRVSRGQIPETEAGRLLMKYFGSIPRSQETLRIDTQDLLSNRVDLYRKQRPAKTIRTTVQIVFPDGVAKPLSQQEEYTFFEKSTYICTHTSVSDDDGDRQSNQHSTSEPSSSGRASLGINPSPRVQTSKVYLWAGEVIHSHIAEPVHSLARRAAKELPDCYTPPQLIRQGQEPAEFLHALGGIFVTRRKSRLTSSKQYMLCGRKHLGAIVFDEVEFSPASLCAGFVYLVSCPVSLKEIKTFIWKGSECSTDELSAARLAATDLSETGDVTEIEAGMETPGFLRMFGIGTTKASIDTSPEFWTYKSLSENKFTIRLFRIMPPLESPRSTSSLFSALWGRRPSWNSTSSAPASSPTSTPILSTASSPTSPVPGVTAASKPPSVTQISPFTQIHLDPEGIYVLDGYSEIYILIGPLFTSLFTHKSHSSSPSSPQLHPSSAAATAASPSNKMSTTTQLRQSLLYQTLLFASDYAILSASVEDRLCIPKSWVLFSGVPPKYIRCLFRGWDENRRFWGTASLMAGSAATAAGSGPGTGTRQSLTPRLGPLGSASRDVEVVVLDEVLKEIFRT